MTPKKIILNAVVFFAFLTGNLAAEPLRPNFVVFLADDMGWGDSATYGHPLIQTPNLDKLASQGGEVHPMLFRLGSVLAVALGHSHGADAVSQRRLATSFRQSRYSSASERDHLSEAPQGHRLRKPAMSESGISIRSPSSTIPSSLNPAIMATTTCFYTHNNASPSHENPDNFVRNGEPVGKLDGYSAPLVAAEAARWLKDMRDPEKPFVLSVWIHEPHSPIATDQKFQALYDGHENAKYMGNITQLDHALGMVMAALDDTGTADDTFLFFSSDNGPVARFGGTTGGLRGGKRSSHEGGIRVPGIARWPGRIPAGTTSDVPVIGTDIFSTILDIVDIPLPSDRTIDGVSMIPAFEGKPVERRLPLFLAHSCQPGR